MLLTALPALGQNYLPRDVQGFVDRREGCEWVRGEIRRMNEVSRELRRLCESTDKDLLQLKKKYAGNSTIMQILNQFATDIEAAKAPPSKRSAVTRAG
jgi:hypothetical protein